jgi:ATP-dependent Clp protease ATP-binding subunit ClpX
MLEGAIATVPPQGGRKLPQQNYIELNTKNILFICGGAFEGLEKVIEQRTGRKVLGFGREQAAGTKEERARMLRHVAPEDMIKFGLIPELVGRLPVVGVLDPLDDAALIEILTRPKNALTKQYKKLFQMEDVELIFDETDIRAIARIARQRETGARGLRSVMEETMLHLMYDIPSRTDVRKVVISEDTILKHMEPEIVIQRDRRVKEA